MSAGAPATRGFEGLAFGGLAYRGQALSALLLGTVLLPGTGLLGGCTVPAFVGYDDAGSGRFDGAAADAGSIEGLRALRVEPSSVEIVDDGLEPGERTTVRAIGTFDDGERDVSALVTWSIEDPGLAAVEGGAITTSSRGGRSHVVARAGAASALAELTVVLEMTVLAPGIEPEDVALFPSDPATGEDGAARDVRLAYPSDGTTFPLNVQRVLHEWRAERGLDLFELRWDSELAHVRVVTADRAFLPDARLWEALLATHAGRSVEVRVRALSTRMPAVVLRSQSVQETISSAEVPGALYYWSTGTQGVMRAHVAAASAQTFYAPDSDEGECVACHAVSRDGRRMAVSWGDETLREITVPERELRIPAMPGATGPAYGWGTFEPAPGNRLLYANRGQLSLVDADTGAPLGDIALPTATYATHPDWAPDGTFVAVTLTEREPGNRDLRGSGIARIPVLPDGRLGAPVMVVAPAGFDDTLVFPAVSPDSRWIAYARATGRSKDNATARLYLVRADGSEPPIELAILNQRVSDRDGELATGSTMPTWAPTTEPGTQWLAFSSTRAYGTTVVGGVRDQLWAAAIDVERAEAGIDPSYAAFWLPFQTLGEGNHRALWARTEEDTCPSTIEICDGYDDDCDGVVDDACCTPEPEECDNGRDDDCDGAQDEGCGCTAQEICDNGLDDDCDQRVDAFDEDCIVF